MREELTLALGEMHKKSRLYLIVVGVSSSVSLFVFCPELQITKRVKYDKLLLKLKRVGEVSVEYVIVFFSNQMFQKIAQITRS